MWFLWLYYKYKQQYKFLHPFLKYYTLKKVFYLWTKYKHKYARNLKYVNVIYGLMFSSNCF